MQQFSGKIRLSRLKRLLEKRLLRRRKWRGITQEDVCKIKNDSEKVK